MGDQMHRAVHTVALLLVLAAQTTSGGCQDTGGAGSDAGCSFSLVTIDQQHGGVHGEVHLVCDPTPTSFIGDVWLQVPGDAFVSWRPIGHDTIAHLEPDAEGYPIGANAAPCPPNTPISMGVHLRYTSPDGAHHEVTGQTDDKIVC